MKKKLSTLLITSLSIFSCYCCAQTNPASNKVNTVQPKIMVIPYTKEGEDIRTVLEADVNRRVAVTKVKESFDNRNFTTVDFTAKLKSAMDDQLFTSTSLTDLKTQLVEMSGADIYVEVEVPPMVATGGGNSARLILTGYDASTANSLSNKVCESPKFFTSDYGALVTKALGTCSEEFLNTMQVKFSDIVENGRSVKINFTLAQGSKYKFSTELQPEGLPFSDVLEAWMSDNSLKNNYHIQGTTDLKMLFDDVRIPLKDEKGRNYNPNQFALKIFQFLKTKGMSSAKEIKNGTIFITIK
ncbi:MAG TPA: DUF6175 family protein [Ferruginibacter sp.]|nr:DUF6175 family protein [Ferruginibacter sp.]